MLADRETRDSYGYTKWPTKRKKKEKSKDFVPIHHEQQRLAPGKRPRVKMSSAPLK